jgi:hypothetical protein
MAVQDGEEKTTRVDMPDHKDKEKDFLVSSQDHYPSYGGCLTHLMDLSGIMGTPIPLQAHREF